MHTKLSGLPYVPYLIPEPMSVAQSGLHDMGRFSETNGTIFGHCFGHVLWCLGTLFPSLFDSKFYHDSKDKKVKTKQ